MFLYITTDNANIKDKPNSTNMNRVQKAKLDSYKLVIRVADENPVSVKLIPKFEKGIAKLKVIVTEIGVLQPEQEKDISGITVEKNFSEEELTNLVVDIAGAVYSYADEKDDKALMKMVDYKASKVDGLDEADLIAAAGIVHAEALKIPEADLLNEGVKAEDVTKLGTILKSYQDIKVTPRDAIIGRANVTLKLENEFKKASKLMLNSLNRLAPQYKQKDPDFYEKYKSARNVIYRSATKKEPETGK
jgi:hypothetical protein